MAQKKETELLAGTIKRLLAARAHVDAQDNAGRTALHWASHMGSASLAQLLITAGAKQTVLDVEKRTAKDVAEDHGHGEVAQLLLNHGGLSKEL